MVRKHMFSVAAVLAACLTGAVRDGAASDAVPPPAPRCRAAVLVYHHIGYLRVGATRAERNVTTSPEAFERHMKLLKDESFNVIPYDDLVSCMNGGPPTPPKAVVITFDDGIKSQYTRALPIMERYGHKAIFFIVTDFAGGGSSLMTWDDVRDLEKRGMAVGSHTRTHPWLTHEPDDRLAGQLSSSKSRLESELGHPVDHLAYPFGDFNDRVGRAAAAAGYKSARSISRGTDHVQADLYRLRIVYVTDSIWTFRHAITPAD